MKKTILRASLSTLLIFSSSTVWAQETTMQHTAGMNHSAMTSESSAEMNHTMTMDATGSVPTEPGQGAFAALLEIVSILRNDPETDWNKVNINGLRQHLVDMDMLVTNAEVTTQKLKNGLIMTASRKGLGGGAVSRMVPAHSPFLAKETGWNSDVLVNDDTVVWTVTSDQEFYIIQALDFFGLMTIGAHHQTHHLGMAKGEMVHQQ